MSTINNGKIQYSFFPISHVVLESNSFKKLKPSTKVFYFYLAKLSNQYAKETGWFWHSCKQLALMTGLTETTIRGAKKQLLKEGFIDSRLGKYDQDRNVRSASSYSIQKYDRILDEPRDVSF